MAGKNNSEVKPLTEEEENIYKSIAINGDISYIRVGPKGYMVMSNFLKHKDTILNMPLRPSDIFVATYPRSGTTWSQEMVWLLANDLDFKTAKEIPLIKRYPFLEEIMFFSEKIMEEARANAKAQEDFDFLKSVVIPAIEILANTTSRRFVKTHLPFSLLPEKLLDTCKVVYVARDPRDVAVSYYHFMSPNKLVGFSCTFKHYYYKMFTTNLVLWAPYFEHVKEAWAQRNHPNLMFIFYEELSGDLVGTARRVATFLGKQYTDDQLQLLAEHLEFSNFQKNEAMELQHFHKLGIIEKHDKNFVRRGKSGGWRDYFDEEMTKHAQAWMEENLRGTDLRFPQQNK